MSTPFTFGIPLIGRRAAGDWARVEALLELTVSSLLSQTDGDFRIVIAGHDRPRSADRDRRVAFLEADWPQRPPDSRNSDGGRKKGLIVREVLDSGGGLLMFVDADDWLDPALVETVRARIEPGHVGAVLRSGYAIDVATLRAARLPDSRLFDLEFDRVCGTSTVHRLEPDEPDPVRRNPYSVLHEHYRFVELARRHRLPILELPVTGAYAVNTSENHSELHGPFADWRRELCERINRVGEPLDRDSASRFGLRIEDVRAVSNCLVGRRPW